ncbi:NUDIX hydrolase [Desulfurispirillum indicum]|uniref:NUDIX hydrolase n=1 Tax=Desulfurispirillum indicum TaxID=936456 RepID=UPI001CFBC568|nr:NUDIX hydrolase [Desulfurispirillum indicum]UCZ56972.1 NUDIX hydrolase [Desulfurispirillum indicum]
MGKYLELKSRDGWEYVSRVQCEGAVIVLIHNRDTGLYLMVEQYRPPVAQRVLEFPAGLIDAGETPLQTAVRELREEAGIDAQPGELLDLGYVYSSVGMSDEKIFFFAITIDNSREVHPLNLQGAEAHHGLVSRWVPEEAVLTSKAAKAQSILARFQASRKNPGLTF